MENEDTPSTSDRQSAAVRREQLIDAAIEVIATDGLAGATTRAITDQAGLALGAFHYVFDSKDELLDAVIQRVVADIGATLSEAAEAAEPASSESRDGRELVVHVLRRFLVQLWPYLRQTRELQLSQYELTLHALRDGDKEHLAHHQYQLLVDTVTELLRDLTSELDATTSAELARYLVATIDGLLLQWLVEDDTAAADRRLSRFLASLPAVVAAHVDPVVDEVLAS